MGADRVIDAGLRGRPREIESREITNAVRYLARSGCGWFRELGATFPVPDYS